MDCRTLVEPEHAVFQVYPYGGIQMKRLSTAFAAMCLSTAAWAQAPNITAVLDAGSYTANLAQGSIFVVKGTNLSSATTNGGFSQAGFPLPATLAGVKITFTPVAGGAGTD